MSLPGLRNTLLLPAVLILTGLLCAPAQAESLQTGKAFPDFTLPSAFLDFGQRLSEQRGKPVMLILPGRCDRCEEDLLPLQLLSASFALDDLVSWVVWDAYKDDQPPRLHMPVLRQTPGWLTGISALPEAPAVLLISRDGTLDHIIQGRLSRLPDMTRQQLQAWMSSGQRRSPKP